MWKTFLLDCFNYNNETRLDAYQTFSEERWGAFEKKSVLVCHGCTDDFATRTPITDNRKKDYVNFLIVPVKSRESTFVVAARAMLHDTVTSNKRAVQPKTVKTSFMNLADSLASPAIIQEPKFTKKQMTVTIDSNNPKRLNVVFPIKLSGNVEISSRDVYCGLYLNCR